MEKTNILLCEDDENLGMLLREYLNAKGFDTKLCADGEAGYKAFTEDKYDLCVFDVMMPRKDGFTLAKEIKQELQDYELLVGRNENGKRPEKEIGIHSLRLGNIVGEHEVIVATDSQVITLKHEAQSRSLFAEGALDAARFISAQQPGLYSMKDLVK